MNLATKQQQTQRYREQTWLPRRRGDRGGIDWEFGVSRYKILYAEWVNNKALLCSTRGLDYIQYPMINHNRNEYIYVCVCVV